MNDIDIHHLAAAYALDAVDDHERAEFEAHYPTCPICRPEVAGFRETLSHVAGAVAVPPPPSLKTSVMAEIGTTRQLSPLLPQSVTDLASYRQRRQRALRAVLAAAAALLVATGAFVVGRQSGSSDGYAAAAAHVLEQPDARITALTGAGTGTFKVAWSPSAERVVVLGDGLADPGAGKVYELWRIDDAGAHAVRLLDPAGGGRVRKVLDVSGSPAQWAVTIEQAAGADAPTSDPIFAGAV